MRRRLHEIPVTLIALVALSGCVQATRHSNTMIFGTNTQLGIRAGAGVTSVPEVNVGYSRQEAVVMPLVANSRDDGRYQSPCDPSRAVQVSGGAQFAVHPCVLVGVNKELQDSYSVLASFGAKFDGGADKTGARASGGLAQYFATGAAAQLLAITGGAAVVSVGEAAAAAASNPSSSEAEIRALFGDASTIERGTAIRDNYETFRTQLLGKVSLTGDLEFKDKFSAFETAAGIKEGLSLQPDCLTRAACAEAIRANDPYLNRYAELADALTQALAAWKTDTP